MSFLEGDLHKKNALDRQKYIALNVASIRLMRDLTVENSVIGMIERRLLEEIGLNAVTSQWLLLCAFECDGGGSETVSGSFLSCVEESSE